MTQKANFDGFLGAPSCPFVVDWVCSFAATDQDRKFGRIAHLAIAAYN